MRRRDADRMAEGLIRLWRSLVPPTAELTTPQAYALGTIVLQGPLRMGALAAALAARGLVLRESDPDDARAVRVAATRAGIEDQRERRRRFTERLGALMDDLSDHERRQLAESLETLNRLFSDRPATRERRA